MHLNTAWFIIMTGKATNIRYSIECWFDKRRAEERIRELKKDPFVNEEEFEFSLSEGACQDPGEHITNLIKDNGLLEHLDGVSYATQVGAIIKACVETQPLGIIEEVEKFINNETKVVISKDGKFSHVYARELKS